MRHRPSRTFATPASLSHRRSLFFSTLITSAAATAPVRASLACNQAPSAPIIGRMADRASNRWRVAAGGLAPGTVGPGMLAAGLPLTALIGLPLAAITNASNQNPATAVVGGLGNKARRSRRLGILFTVGDLASAVGPPLAYTLMPVLGIRNIYLLGAGLFAFVALEALRRAATSISRPAPI